MISTRKSRSEDEVHIPNAELRSSAELLTELQNAEGGETCLGQSKIASRRLARTPSAFLQAKRPFSRKEPFLRPRESSIIL